MLRLLYSRPLVLNTVIRKTRQLTISYRSVQRDFDDDHPRLELATPHSELFEVLDHRSFQLQSTCPPFKAPLRSRKSQTNVPKEPVPQSIELARPTPSKFKKAKKEPKTSSPLVSPNRLAELSERLHLDHPASLPTSSIDEEVDESLIAEPILPPTVEEMSFNDEDKTLNDLLGSLHSKKVRSMHKYTDEQLSFMHKHNEFNCMLQSYIEVSLYNGQLGKARRFLDDLLADQDRRQTMKRMSWRYVSNIHVYNAFFFAYAEKGNLVALQVLFEKMRKSQVKPTLDSYAAVLSCLGKMDLFDPQVARRLILDIEKLSFRVVDIFNLERLDHLHTQNILKVLKTFRPDFDIPVRSSTVQNKLLNDLYQTPASTIVADDDASHTWWKDVDLAEKLNEQIRMEREQKVKIRSINVSKDIDDKLKVRYDDFMASLSHQLTVGFLADVDVLKRSTKKDLHLTILPFLELFDVKEHSDFMLKELTQHFYASEFYSSPHHNLCLALGKRFYQKYLCAVREKTGFLDKLRLVYDDYMKYAVTHERFVTSERAKWNELVKDKFAYMDRTDRPWTYTQILQIGEFFYDVMLKHLKLRSPLLTTKNDRQKKKNTDSVLYTVYRTPGNFTEKQIKVHPTVLHFFTHIPQTELEFDCKELPCLTPPLPWLSASIGGYLLNQTDFVRLPISAAQQDARLRSLPSEKIGGLLDSINILNSCAWKINTNVLDLLIDLFRRGGSRQLSVPVSIETANIKEPLPVEKGLSLDERKRRETSAAIARKHRAEIYSLWCYELYRLSIANHFRDETFWFPHNLDFRGRVYPVPPHFNHLGSDVARSIILFADGKPLGDKGLERLKIHLVNLTDLKKKSSIADRAKYADEIMDDILDSADRPLDGRQWWSKSEEPWQTLACCMEIARAIRSPDHRKYISHFPVHQDGSCNVLQHYAAMGLDDVGAASVNLKPSDLPQDVYSVVVDQVEHERQQDAANGVEIAKILQGFVKRKVIKQTIMTTNYGVTMYGARQQISRQLRDIDEFPRESVSEASVYLAEKTFFSLRELFRETRKIQDWFTDCASQISSVRGSAVEWNTPLNLPVVQPYYREMRTRQRGKDIYDSYSSFARPNNVKQKNAFPPNYVHSLDSTHMMMTALQCARHGITFVSVHDSFWTHACDVDRLGHYCRQQFISLHKEPLLEVLSRDFLAKYEFKSSEFARANEMQRKTMKLLNDTLRRVPERGTFQLDSVLDSTYFFS